jgi:hypothetical protein
MHPYYTAIQQPKRKNEHAVSSSSLLEGPGGLGMILLQQEGEVEHYSIEILDTNRWLIKIPTSFRIEQASSSTMTSSCTAAAAAAQILKASL